MLIRRISDGNFRTIVVKRRFIMHCNATTAKICFKLIIACGMMQQQYQQINFVI